MEAYVFASMVNKFRFRTFAVASGQSVWSQHQYQDIVYVAISSSLSGGVDAQIKIKIEGYFHDSL
jgi:hypothetical protein